MAAAGGPLRLALVTRRFWPLVGGAESAMANLAAELVRQGHSVTLLTAQWQHDWPATVTHRSVPVVRLSQPGQRFVGTLVYMRALAGWLRSHAGELDGVYVSMLKHDAYAAVTALKKLRIPVALRAEGAGLTGDCHWQLEATCGRRIKRRTMQAQAFVAPSPAIERELIAAGFARDRIIAIANGVAIPELPVGGAKLAARADLAEVDLNLKLPADAELAVYTGRLHPKKGLNELVAAWPAVLAQRPQARLWLIGEGPEKQALREQILSLGLADRIAISGPFDQVDDVLAAADLFVLPSHEEGLSLSILEALAAGLPTVATDIPGNRLVIEHEKEGLLVPVSSPEGLAAGILELLGNPERAGRYAEAARARVEGEYSLTRLAERHVELFRRLIAGEAPG